MKKLIKKVIPQRGINLFYHLPEAILANLIYLFPTRKLTVIGVTGTDGKTTTVNMICKILKDWGKRVSMVSSINAITGDKMIDTGFHTTSPGRFKLQKLAKEALKNGSEYLVLEVTSHGLDQFRFWGIKFDIGVITNITHEHLDYHKNFANYLLTKTKLIKDVKWAVLNMDDANFEKISKLTKAKIVSFGRGEAAEVNLSKFKLKLKLLGDYNLLNALAAAAACKILGVPRPTIENTLNKFAFLEGRMQEVRNKKGLKIFIDFAHTPNALNQALLTLKKNTKGKLIAVFGAAAERDSSKRPSMGKISSQIADITVLTDEDPRFEERMSIIEQIASGMKGNSLVYKQPDRRKAIKLAIGLAKRGDTIGIFGKGHEKSMNYLGKEKKWSEYLAVRSALR